MLKFAEEQNILDVLITSKNILNLSVGKKESLADS
jgi:hypothetical protein